jgi:hypothetical protein
MPFDATSFSFPFVVVCCEVRGAWLAWLGLGGMGIRLRVLTFLVPEFRGARGVKVYLGLLVWKMYSNTCIAARGV